MAAWIFGAIPITDSPGPIFRGASSRRSSERSAMAASAHPPIAGIHAVALPALLALPRQALPACLCQACPRGGGSSRSVDWLDEGAWIPERYRGRSADTGNDQHHVVLLAKRAARAAR